MKASPANMAASVRQRLHNVATERREDFEQVLVRYALERLLYRLSISGYADRFVLKGALLFRLWFDLEQRPTRDADFLGLGSAEPEALAAIFRELATMKVQPEDGLTFDTDSVIAEDIRKVAGYPGVRVSLKAMLANARIPVQCDIGFGDAVTPDPSFEHYPTLLDLPAPKLRVYPLETVIAEKLEAVVKFGAFNSRLKDYFDLWVLMRYERVDPDMVVRAVRATFARRGTPLPAETPAGLTNEFARSRQPAWQAFARRSGLQAPELADTVTALRAYAGGVFDAARRGA
jgi:predicted nucleotidyltransferase component of viral defense system